MHLCRSLTVLLCQQPQDSRHAPNSVCREPSFLPVWWLQLPLPCSAHLMPHHSTGHDNQQLLHSYATSHLRKQCHEEPEIAWSSATVIDRDPNIHQRCELEAWHIRSQDSLLNRELAPCPECTTSDLPPEFHYMSFPMHAWHVCITTIAVHFHTY